MYNFWKRLNICLMIISNHMLCEKERHPFEIEIILHCTKNYGVLSRDEDNINVLFAVQECLLIILHKYWYIKSYSESLVKIVPIKIFQKYNK